MACLHHFYLGEPWGYTAYDEMHMTVNPEEGALLPGDPRPVHGVYMTAISGSTVAVEGALVKARGLLPEYGLAHWFDGAFDSISIPTDLEDVFTITLVCKPALADVAQCLVHAGAGAVYLGFNSSSQVVFLANSVGASGVESDPLTIGRTYLIVARYDGSAGTLYVRELLPSATTEVYGPTTFAVGEAGQGEIGANDGVEYYAGAMQAVSFHDDAFDAAAVAALVATGVWTDVTGDVEIIQPVTFDQGIHDDGPTARVASTGRLSLVLDNRVPDEDGWRSQESAPGYYAPDHANCRAGFTEGIPVRASLPNPEDPTDLRVQFIGTIQTIRMDAGVDRENRTYVTATDWIDEAARSRIRQVTTEENRTGDELIRILLNQMRNRPHELSLRDATDNIAVAFHNVAEKATVLSELVKITMTEYGVLGVTWDGTLVFVPRGAVGTGVAWTIEDAQAMEPERRTDQQRNHIEVTTHPATVGDDPDTVLFGINVPGSLPDEAVVIPNIAEGELVFTFQNPADQNEAVGASDVQIPEATTDYTLNTAADGSGADVTTHDAIALTWTPKSTGMGLTVANGYGQAVYITFLQIKGRPIYSYDAVIATQEDLDSINEKGVQELLIDMPYQADAGVGLALAQYLKSFYANVTTRIKTATFRTVESSAFLNAGLYGQINDTANCVEDASGVDSAYYVRGRRVEWRTPVMMASGDEQDDLTITWHLAPAEAGSGGGGGAGEFWHLDEDTLDETTTLGF